MKLPDAKYIGSTYPYVPKTLESDRCVLSGGGPSITSPKSESFGLKPCDYITMYQSKETPKKGQFLVLERVHTVSRRILEDLKSRCMTLISGRCK